MLEVLPDDQDNSDEAGLAVSCRCCFLDLLLAASFCSGAVVLQAQPFVTGVYLQGPH